MSEFNANLLRRIEKKRKIRLASLLMYSILSFLFFCIGFVGYSAERFDEQELFEHAQLVYAGMALECDVGCGDPFTDSRLHEVDRIFTICVDETVNSLAAYSEESGKSACDPVWDHSGLNEYNLLDWRPMKLRWAQVDRHDRFLEAVAILRGDLEYYQEKILAQFHERIREAQSDLAVLHDLQVRFQQDEEAIESCSSEEIFLLERVDTIDRGIKLLNKEIVSLQKKIARQENIYPSFLTSVGQAEQQIDLIFKNMFLWCLKKHQPEGIAFYAALQYFIMDDFDAALDRIRFLIDLSERYHFGGEFVSKLYLLQGQVELEFCRYSDAIVTLTTAVQKDPQRKEAYFERAAAYFELGEFDLALENYLQSGFQNALNEHRLQWGEFSAFSAGITAGILSGGTEAVLEFVPGILGSLRGVGNGLWAFCSNPIGASERFIQAVHQCINYLKTQSLVTWCQDLIPELKELLQRYDDLEDFEKGKQIGLIIGKYGLDVFCGKTLLSAGKYCVELKRANRLMTLEALSLPKQKERLIAVSSERALHRKQVLESLKIEQAKQAKHIKIDGEKTYIEGKSIWTHPDPQKLLQKFAGTGTIQKGQGIGIAGSVEKVNFKEYIGVHINDDTGVCTPTTWGKIHYSKKGAHIVPALPNKD